MRIFSRYVAANVLPPLIFLHVVACYNAHQTRALKKKHAFDWNKVFDTRYNAW